MGIWEQKSPSIDEAQATQRKAFPSSFRVKDWPKEVFGMGMGLVGGTQPFLSTLPPSKMRRALSLL